MTQGSSLDKPRGASLEAASLSVPVSKVSLGGLHGPGCVSQKVFPVQVAFGHGLDHSNRNLRRPLRLLGRTLHPREEFLTERRLLGQLRVYMEVGKPRKAKGC